jgi:hypothetical protein
MTKYKWLSREEFIARFDIDPSALSGKLQGGDAMLCISAVGNAAVVDYGCAAFADPKHGICIDDKYIDPAREMEPGDLLARRWLPQTYDQGNDGRFQGSIAAGWVYDDMPAMQLTYMNGFGVIWILS